MAGARLFFQVRLRARSRDRGAARAGPPQRAGVPQRYRRRPGEPPAPVSPLPAPREAVRSDRRSFHRARNHSLPESDRPPRPMEVTRRAAAACRTTRRQGRAREAPSRPRLRHHAADMHSRATCPRRCSVAPRSAGVRPARPPPDRAARRQARRQVV